MEFARIQIIPSDEAHKPLCLVLEGIATKFLATLMNCWNAQIESVQPCLHEGAHPDVKEVRKEHPDLFPTGSLDDLIDDDPVDWPDSEDVDADREGEEE